MHEKAEDVDLHSLLTFSDFCPQNEQLPLPVFDKNWHSLSVKAKICKFLFRIQIYRKWYIVSYSAVIVRFTIRVVYFISF